MRKLILFLLLLSNLCSYAQKEETVKFDGKNRNMIVYVPNNLPENSPLVITLHGFNQSAQYQMEHTKWNTVADTAKFVVVYPNYDGGWWDVNGTSDTRFIEHIMDLMHEQYKIDLNRVYISGFSLGAMMTYHCIEVLADKVAAFAPVSGVRFDNKAPVSSRVVPIIHTHCKGDDVFKWGGDPQHASGGYPYIPDYVKSWATYFGMNPEPEFIDPYKANDVDLTIYRSDESCVEVRLLSFDGAGHWHVDADAWGGVSTTSEIWNFCKRYTLNLNEVEPPVLIQADPEDCSFDLPETQREFTLTFDRDALIASLNANLVGNGKTINLQLKKSEEQDELKTSQPTFIIPEDEVIEPGNYILTVDGICTSNYFTRSYSFEYTYGIEETGDKLNVETILSQDWNKIYEQNGECIPAGWQRVDTKNDDSTETLDSTKEAGNGSRLVYVWDYGDITTGFLLTGNDIKNCNINFGKEIEYSINLPVNKYVLSFYSAYWNKGSQRGKATFDVLLHSKSNRGGIRTVVKDKDLSSSDCVEEGNKCPVLDATLHQYTFKVEKKDNYILNFDINQGKKAVVIGGIEITTAPSNADKYKGCFLRLYKQGEYYYDINKDNNEKESELADLLEVLNKYEGFSSTAPSAYEKAIEELKAVIEPFYDYSVSLNHTISDDKVVNTIFYNIDGRKVEPNFPGLFIRKQILNNGKINVDKVLKTR